MSKNALGMNRNPFISNKNINNIQSSATQNNTLKAIIHGQITGKSFRSIRHLGQGFFSHMDRSLNGLASLMMELDDAVTRRDGLKCKSCLVTISKRLSEVTSTFFTENRDWFIQLHGVELLVRILEFPPMQSKAAPPFPPRSRALSPQKRPRTPNGSADASQPVDLYAWKLRNQCMAILRELCYTHPYVGEWLAANNRLIVFLFSLLADAKTFDAAIGLLEEVLGVKEETFDLSLVPGFNALVRGMSKGQLGIFCRVLAMVVFEPDDRNGDEIVSSLELLRTRKRGRYVTPAIRNIDRNHAIVLGIPELFERLVRLLRTNLPISQFSSVTDLLAMHYYHRRGATDFFDEDSWARDDDVDAAEASSSSSSSSGSNGSSSNSSSATSSTSSSWAAAAREAGGAIAAVGSAVAEGDEFRMLNMVDRELEALMDGTAQTLKALALSTYQVELLFVLYALLAGKRKAELQDRLAGLGLIKTVTVLFDKTDWLKQPTLHGPQCECNPDAALKIQLLRLILNFCDGDFENRHNKRLLLSPEELASLYGTEYPTRSSSSKGCDNPGLLSKLISVFYKLPQDQNNRFWMASCIEAFLRGSEPIFQKFVAKSGMLKYLLDDIVAEGTKVAGSMQTSFDLLGELMKFNREIFTEFNELLVGKTEIKFLENMITHLVDSNVFLRGMVLSMERFQEEDKCNEAKPGYSPYPFSQCKIFQFLHSNWFRLVKDLMMVVSVEDINQENICCVNTTMVFCIYARRKEQLRSFIQSIREEEASYRTERGGKQILPPICATANFRSLLWFWHEYYLLRGKDCLSLEYTSHIPFAEWMATYELLVEELGPFDPAALYAGWKEKEGKRKK